jgi:hypothetical protein
MLGGKRLGSWTSSVTEIFVACYDGHWWVFGVETLGLWRLEDAWGNIWFLVLGLVLRQCIVFVGRDAYGSMRLTSTKYYVCRGLSVCLSILVPRSGLVSGMTPEATRKCSDFEYYASVVALGCPRPLEDQIHHQTVRRAAGRELGELLACSHTCPRD